MLLRGFTDSTTSHKHNNVLITEAGFQRMDMKDLNLGEMPSAKLKFQRNYRI